MLPGAQLHSAGVWGPELLGAPPPPASSSYWGAQERVWAQTGNKQQIRKEGLGTDWQQIRRNSSLRGDDTSETCSVNSPAECACCPSSEALQRRLPRRCQVSPHWAPVSLQARCRIRQKSKWMMSIRLQKVLNFICNSTLKTDSDIQKMGQIPQAGYRPARSDA